MVASAWADLFLPARCDSYAGYLITRNDYVVDRRCWVDSAVISFLVLPWLSHHISYIMHNSIVMFLVPSLITDQPLARLVQTYISVCIELLISMQRTRFMASMKAGHSFALYPWSTKLLRNDWTGYKVLNWFLINNHLNTQSIFMICLCISVSDFDLATSNFHHSFNPSATSNFHDSINPFATSIIIIAGSGNWKS